MEQGEKRRTPERDPFWKTYFHYELKLGVGAAERLWEGF